MTDQNKVIRDGTKWLIKYQEESGGWSRSSSGSEKGEAMWAVLGLVSTDVLTINLAGLRRGQHVSGVNTLSINAKDNGGSGVLKVEIAVDDLPVAGSCSDKVDFAWNTEDLDDGIHTLAVKATNKAGQASTRRWIVYAGNTFLTNVGTKFDGDGTKISYRDIAPDSMKRKVEQIHGQKGCRATEHRDAVCTRHTR